MTSWFGASGRAIGARAQCPLATATAAHLQLFLGIQPPQLLVVRRQPLPLQEQTEPPIAEPPAFACQCTQPSPQRKRPPIDVQMSG